MTHEQVEFTRRQLLEKCKEEHRLTMVAIDALPEDKLAWKPDAEKAWAAGALAEHSVTAASFFVCQVTGKHPEGGPPPPAETKDELVTRCKRAADDYMQKLTEMTVVVITKLVHV